MTRVVVMEFLKKYKSGDYKVYQRKINSECALWFPRAPFSSCYILIIIIMKVCNNARYTLVFSGNNHVLLVLMRVLEIVNSSDNELNHVLHENVKVNMGQIF